VQKEKKTWEKPSKTCLAPKIIRFYISLCIILLGEVMKYRALIERDEDGVFVATVPALPGCISEGKTRREALKNIEDAISGYLASLKKHNEPIPPAID